MNSPLRSDTTDSRRWNRRIVEEIEIVNDDRTAAHLNNIFIKNK